MAVPNPTCGYVDALASLPLTCGTGYCGFKSTLGAAGCCTSAISVGASYSLTGCIFVTACYAATDIVACAGGCNFNTRDLLCSNPASPECVQYTFTDISSTALFCSDRQAVVDVARTFAANAVATGSPSLSPGGGAVATTGLATARSTRRSATYTSSYIPQATTASSSAAVTTSIVPLTSVVAVTSSVAAAGAPDPFTQSQASSGNVGGVGTATPVAKGGCGRVGISRVLKLAGCFFIGLAFVIV